MPAAAHSVPTPDIWCTIRLQEATMKVAFITGASTGIGRATLQKFVRENVRVAFMDMNEQDGMDLQNQYTDDQVLFLPGDVRSIPAITAAVEKAVSHFGKLDIVFPNAGVNRLNTILDITEEEWDLIIDTNLKGMVFTVRETVPYLIENGGGSIVLMGSDQTLVGKRVQFAYGASKGAIGQITKSLALDLAEKNIRVNAVCPGTIRTPLADAQIQKFATVDPSISPEQVWAVESSRSPMGRIGLAEEVAEVVCFLASDRASYVTGSLYLVDGGFTAG